MAIGLVLGTLAAAALVSNGQGVGATHIVARPPVSPLPSQVVPGAGRRQVLRSALATFTVPMFSLSALAADADTIPDIRPSTTRMGGMLDAYSDVGKGWSIYKPSTWNKFDAAPGEYDAKWQDVVGVTEQIVVSSSPVTEGKNIDALGTPDDLGAKVSKLRDLSLVKAKSLRVGGLLMYLVELAGQGGHELIGFTVSKGKLWRITAKAAETRWAKNEEMYMNVITSFQTKIL